MEVKGVDLFDDLRNKICIRPSYVECAEAWLRATNNGEPAGGIGHLGSTISQFQYNCIHDIVIN
jgi:hypothetical protein